MALKLTDEQRQAIHEHDGQPVMIVDDQTQARYLLVPVDEFEQLRKMDPDEEFQPREMYPLVAEALREIWEDPAMDVYDDYDANHRS